MNALELPSEQMPYMFLPAERFSRISQEAQCSFAEGSFVEHQSENIPEWVCELCDTVQRFKNKSEYKYVGHDP